jgi:hypothetical protein
LSHYLRRSQRMECVFSFGELLLVVVLLPLLVDFYQSSRDVFFMLLHWLL